LGRYPTQKDNPRKEDHLIVQKHAFGLRGLLAAIVIIVLSTGAAAAASSHAAQGLATAAEKAGKTVPVAAQEETNEDEQVEETEETEQETESAADSEHCATDPTTLDETALAELNHGAIVCWAAHQETPAEFDNHGAWVSSWAKDNHGHDGTHGKPENAGQH
jgi:hypothetical protein